MFIEIRSTPVRNSCKPILFAALLILVLLIGLVEGQVGGASAPLRPSAPTFAAPVPKLTSAIPKPGAPVSKPTAPFPKPAAPVLKPTPILKPGAPVSKPTAPFSKPAAPALKPTSPVPKPGAPAPVPKPISAVPKPAAPVPKPTAPATKPKPTAQPIMKPSRKPSTKPSTSPSFKLFVPPFILNTDPLPKYPFPNGVCNNQNTNVRPPIPEVESRRDAVKRVYLKYTPSGEYDAKATYKYFITSQPGGATYMNRMVALMYTEAALNEYDVVMISYANAAARFVHNGTTYKWPNAQLGGPPLAFTSWLFIDMFARFNCLMEDDFKDEVFQFFQNWPYTDSWTTSNLQTLRSHIGYLAGILWPQMNFSAPNTFPYSRFVSDATMHARKYNYYGPWETFSDVYGYYNLFPTVTTAHFANNTALAAVADIGVQMALARYATFWQLGRLNAQCARCESNWIHNFHQWGFRAELWLFFGDNDINLLAAPTGERNWLLWYLAAVNYHLDADILAIASQKKTGRVSLIMPGQNTFFFDSYLTKSYALYRNGSPGMQFGGIPGQSTFPGIQWNGYNSSYNAIRSNMYVGVFEDCFLWGNCGKWNGAPNTWMLHKNSLLLVVDNKRNSSFMYDVYKKPTATIVAGSFPSSTDFPDQVYNFSCANVTCNGAYRLFYGYGINSVLIAVTSNQPFRVFPKLIDINYNVYKYVLNDRSWYTNLSASDPSIQHFGAAGFAMEAADPNDYVGVTLQERLQAFANGILSKTSFLWQEPSSNVSRAQLTYKDLEGNLIYKQWMDEQNKPVQTQHWMNQSGLESVNGVDPTIYQFQNIHESPYLFQSYYNCTKGMNFAQYSYGNFMPCPFWIRANSSSPWKEYKNPQLTWKDAWSRLEQYFGPTCRCNPPP
jgi:hypothetical protein